MPTDNDRASASIRFKGEARRLTIRRPRLDRDRLFLFGRRYAAQTVTLTLDDVDRLHRGCTIAVDVAGQYLIYLRVDQRDDYGSERPTCSAAASGCSGCTGGGIRQREHPDRVPSDLVRAVAARVRVNADRRAGVHTPQWIIDLANSEQIIYWHSDHGRSKRFIPARGLSRLRQKWRAIAARVPVRRTHGGPQ